MPRPRPTTQIEPRLRAAEAAELLGVSARMVQVMCARGEISAIRVGRLWTTTESALTDYLTGRTPQRAPSPAPLSHDMLKNAPARPAERSAAMRATPPAPALSPAPTRSRFESLLRRRS
jgi:excisionase family DNA binding protein